VGPATNRNSTENALTAWSRTLAVLALFVIGAALWNLQAARDGLKIEHVAIDGTPATIFQLPSGKPGPVVVIAHGFAGSQQLMQSFALTLAHNGFTAITFDFAGHGRNPEPLSGSITEEAGATARLLAELGRVAAYARPLGDGRLAVLGHSMASDIVVRFAKLSPDVAATIAVSMFSREVTSTRPSNLLVIVGDWEEMLKREALRAVGLASAPARAEANVTYGNVATGTGRRVAISPLTEHVGVLYSRASTQEAVAWLDATFATTRKSNTYLDASGGWILLLLAAVVALAFEISTWLPTVCDRPAGAGLPWRRLWLPLLLPMVATPLLLRVMPTHFLPVLVGDYLAAHFALYGLITAACIVWLPGSRPIPGYGAMSTDALVAATVAVVAFGFIAIVWPLNAYVTSFIPGPERVPLVAAMLVGTLLYFLSDEWLTRGEGAGRGAYIASKAAFLVSLAVAVGLDFERLFFLVIIIPVIVVFFLVYGLFSRWAYERTRHPFVAGIANAIAFAWAIGVSFPLMAG
jgi:pimeloyl-ACP methyl ester carboxylesterase